MATDIAVQLENTCKTIASPKFREQLSASLPPGVDIDRFTRVTLTAIQQNPDILKCDRQTLYLSVNRAAADGLMPDGREGAIVSFGGAAQWMPMVLGVIKRLAKAGVSIEAQVVHDADTFEYALGDAPFITHRTPKLGTPRGDMIGVYAIARTKDGQVFREVMSREDVEKVRQASRSKGSGPWTQWFTEMARKTVIRRLAKRLPMLDPEVMDTVARDDDMYGPAMDEPAQAAAPEPKAAKGPRRPAAFDGVVKSDASEPEAPADDRPEQQASRPEPQAASDRPPIDGESSRVERPSAAAADGVDF